MDIVAHGLWAGLATAAVARRQRDQGAEVSAGLVAGSAVLAMVPDLGHMLPIVAWALLGDGSWQAALAYIRAQPGGEPWLPDAVKLWSHTLHCVGHSALVGAAVTAVVWRWWRPGLLLLLGWWTHIVLDVFTHSANYYPSPVLWPITRRGFDGIAWPTPWFMVLNYSALAVAGALWGLSVWRRRRRRHRLAGPDRGA